MATFGPSGGNGGMKYSDQVTLDIEMPKTRMEITTIYIWSGTLIDGIQLSYTNSLGGTHLGGMHGGRTGAMTQIDLGFSHIVGVTGTIAANVSIHGITGTFVESLNLVLSDGKVCFFGGSGGQQTYFYQADPVVQVGGIGFEDEIIGFFGTSGGLVDSIGVITQHIISQPTPHS